MMAGAHDDTHLVGSTAVLGVVGIECPSPHGWPHEVSTQAENQLEHFRIETVVAVVGAPCVLYPRGEAWSLVVEEESAVAHGWFAVGVGAFHYINVIMMRRRNICPPVPRRHSYLARKFINAEDGASAVASGDSNAPVTCRLNDEFLILSLQLLAVNDTLFHQFVNLLRMAYRSRDDTCFAFRNYCCVGSRHPSEVLGKVPCGNHNSLQVLLVNENCCHSVACHLNVSAVERDKLLCSRCRQCN